MTAKKRKHLSYSQFAMFASCPRRYWHKYINPSARLDLATSAMVEGARLHHLVAGSLNRGDLSFVPRSQYERIMNLIEQGWTTYIEQEFVIALPSLDCKAIIDLALVSPSGTEALIIDWKSNHLPDNDEQLRVYAVALSARYSELQIVRASYVSLSTQAYRSFVYTSDLLAEVYTRLRAEAEELSSSEDIKDYPKRPSTACMTCPYVKSCISNDYEIPFTSVEQAIELAQLGDALASQATAYIKQYLLERGESRVATESAGYNLTWSATLRSFKPKPEIK